MQGLDESLPNKSDHRSPGDSPAPEKSANSSPKKDSRKVVLNALALVAMPITIGTYLWVSNPFKDELAREVYSLSSLSPAQEYNIDKAARALDGRVLKPGELFGFNRA